MKNIRNYSVKFYHIFVVFLFVSLSFQRGVAQGGPIDGTIKLYFETIEKTKAQMDVLLTGDSIIYLQVYAEFSPEFTKVRLDYTDFGSSSFSWALCDKDGAFASSPSKDVMLLGHLNDNCPQGGQASQDRGAASYDFAQLGCPKFGHYASVGSGGDFNLHQSGLPENTVKMGTIGFKLLSSDGFFVRMENTGKQIDLSFGAVIFNIKDDYGTVGWGGAASDWGKAGPERFDISQVGGVVVKKGFKNKSV